MHVVGLHSGALGDVILFGRLLSMLPGRRTLIAGGAKARLLQGLGAVEQAVDFESLPLHALFQPASDHDATLQPILACDRLVSCFAATDSAAAERLRVLSGAKQADFLPIRPPANEESGKRHLLSVWADQMGLADPAGVDWQGWHAPQAWRDEAHALVDPLGLADQAWAVLAPGAGSVEKCWPAERFAALADWFAAQGIQSVVLMGPTEAERDPADFAPLRNLPMIWAPPLETVAGLLSESVCFVGNDTGPAHLAGAVGVPTMVLFGPTCAEQFLPVGPSVRAVFGAKMSEIGVDLAISQFEGWV